MSTPPLPADPTTGSPAPAGPSRAARIRNWTVAVPNTYFRTSSPPGPEALKHALWVGDGTTEWADQDAAYRTALLDQYKIYVEMADRISARRGLANTYFLTLNTAITTAIGVFWQRPPQASEWLLVAPLLALLGQCLAWFLIIRSYRQLNSGKYMVIGAMEQRLPASPYYAAEWTALGSGRNPAAYLPLSHVEQLIPAFFAIVYVAGFISIVLA